MQARLDALTSALGNAEVLLTTYYLQARLDALTSALGNAERRHSAGLSSVETFRGSLESLQMSSVKAQARVNEAECATARAYSLSLEF